MKMTKDNMPLKFGKYKGRTPHEIADIDSGYIIWAYTNMKAKICSRQLFEACQQDAMEYEYEKGIDLHFGLDGW